MQCTPSHPTFLSSSVLLLIHLRLDLISCVFPSCLFKMSPRTSPFSHHSICSTHPIITRITFGRRSEQLGTLSTVWWDVPPVGYVTAAIIANTRHKWRTKILQRKRPPHSTIRSSQSPETSLRTAVAARASNACGKVLNVGWICTAENEFGQIRPSLFWHHVIYIYIYIYIYIANRLGRHSSNSYF